MKISITSALLLAATVVTGLLAGASLDQSIKQLPARHKIGMSNYSQYMRAADLGNGIPYLGALGIGAAGLTLATAISAFRQERRSRRVRALTRLVCWQCFTHLQHYKQLPPLSANARSISATRQRLQKPSTALNDGRQSASHTKS
jgi:hypothetical protein